MKRTPKVLLAAAAVVALATACGTTVPQTTSLGGQSAAGGSLAAGGSGELGAGSSSTSSGVAGATTGATAQGTTAGTTVGGSGVSGAAQGTAGAGSPVTANAAAGTGTVPRPGATSAGKTAVTTSAKPAAGKTAAKGGSASGTKTGSTAAAAPGAASGVGVSDTAINIGIGYQTDSGAADSAIGASGSDPGSSQSYAVAVVNDINAHGGLGGRKLNPIYNASSATSTETTDEQEQSACTNYTQDNHVFATMDIGDDTFNACMEQSAVQVGYSETGYVASDFQKYPYMWQPNYLDMDTQYRDSVNDWAQDGYLTPWNTTTGAAGNATTNPVKIGILSVNLPALTYITNDVIVPGLAAKGFKVNSSDIVFLNNPANESGEGAMVAAISSAELKFASDGVTHVIITDNAGGVTFIFGEDAQSQNYKPRFGVNSDNELQGLLSANEFPTSEANGAMGLGWEPTQDLPDADTGTGTPYYTSGRAHCDAVMAAAGITFANTSAEGVALGYCDKLYFLKAVIDSMGHTVTRDGFNAAAEKLGSSFSVGAFTKSYFGPSHHWGAVVGWDTQYDSSCTCMVYKGNSFTLN